MAQEIAALSLKEPARKRLTEAIGAIQKEVRTLELRIDGYTEKLNGKRVKDHDKKEFARRLRETRRQLREIEAEHHLTGVFRFARPLWHFEEHFGLNSVALIKI